MTERTVWQNQFTSSHHERDRSVWREAVGLGGSWDGIVTGDEPAVPRVRDRGAGMWAAGGDGERQGVDGRGEEGSGEEGSGEEGFRNEERGDEDE